MIEKLNWKYNRDRSVWELYDKLNEIIEVMNGHENPVYIDLDSKKAEEE